MNKFVNFELPFIVFYRSLLKFILDNKGYIFSYINSHSVKRHCFYYRFSAIHMIRHDFFPCVHPDRLSIIWPDWKWQLLLWCLCHSIYDTEWNLWSCKNMELDIRSRSQCEHILQIPMPKDPVLVIALSFQRHNVKSLIIVYFWCL